LRSWRLDRASDLDLVDLGLNDRSFEALRAGEIDAALLPPEKAFLAEAEGFRLIADSLGLECHWVPLATTGRFLAENRQLVTKVASIYRDSIQLFKLDWQLTLKAIGRQLPALTSKPQVLEKCYHLFASLFEPTMMPSLSSLSAVLDEVALQDLRAKKLQMSLLVENLL